MTGSRERVVGGVHVHSAYSRDGHDTLAAIRDRAIARGMRFLAMTDHAEDFDQARYTEYKAECGGLSDDRFTLIPGLEFRFNKLRGLHLLACGLDEWSQPPTLYDFADHVATRAKLTILAHPVLTAYRVPEVIRECVDAVEVWNAAYNTRYLPDPRAMQLMRVIRAQRPAVVATAGLDQHDASNDRRTRVVLTDSRDLADPLVAIREGRFYNRGATMSFSADAEFSTPGRLALTAVRTIFDRVEWTHERIARAWQRRSARLRQ